MTAIRSDLSLYIPYVTLEFSKEYVTGVIEGAGLGIVSRVDLVLKIDNFGRQYNNAYVHFAEWFDSDYNRRFQARVLSFDGTTIAIKHYPHVWSVRENKAVKRIPGERRQRINLTDLQEPTTHDESVENPSFARKYTEDFMEENATLVAENERLRAALDEMEKKSVLSAHSAIYQNKRAASQKLKIAELVCENAELQKIPTDTDLFQMEVKKHAACMNRSQLEKQEAKIAELQADNAELKQQLQEQVIHRHMTSDFREKLAETEEHLKLMTNEIAKLKKKMASLEYENQILRDGPEEEPNLDGEWPQESIEAIIDRENMIDQIVSIIENSPTFFDAKKNVQVLYKDSPYYPIASYLIKPEEPEDSSQQPTFEEWQEEYEDWRNEVGVKR